MILIAAYSSDGCEGRCDSRCYNSTSRRCSCVCGSANHGVGLEAARLNTRALAETWMAHFQVFEEVNAAEGAAGAQDETKPTPKILRWDVPALIPFHQQMLPIALLTDEPSERQERVIP